MDLPEFPYHPDPYASGVVAGAEAECECCGHARGLFYTGPFYAVEEVTYLCLWCVADGMAAQKFNGEFVDPYNFIDAQLNKDVIEIVTRRTPSYHAWQQEQWLVHCNDACEFHGMPTRAELESASDSVKAEWARREGRKRGDWEFAVDGFVSGQAGFYKFVCRHCRQLLFATDWN